MTVPLQDIIQKNKHLSPSTIQFLYQKYHIEV